MKYIFTILLALSIGMPSYGMRMRRVRQVTGCCCPLVASILVSGVAVKLERSVQSKVSGTINKGLDSLFGKIKKD